MEKVIHRHMVKSPYVSDGDASLKEAIELMKECNIRHLPITEDDRLVGLVSERDLREALVLPQSANLRLADVMKTDLYIASRTTPLLDVVREMQERKIGSTLVVNDKMECVGIFTTIDALGILADMLEDDESNSRVLHLDDYVDYWTIPQTMVI